MNQRIQELYIKTLSEECSNPALVDIEKFAELIVRECMNKTAGYLLEDEFGGSDVKEASEELAKHFGVEE